MAPWKKPLRRIVAASVARARMLPINGTDSGQAAGEFSAGVLADLLSDSHAPFQSKTHSAC